MPIKNSLIFISSFNVQNTHRWYRHTFKSRSIPVTTETNYN